MGQILAARVVNNAPAGLFAAFAIIWLLFAAAGISSFVFLILSVVDITKRPEWQWRVSGQEKIVWLLLSILIALPCAFIYWFGIRRKLVAAEADGPPPGMIAPPYGPGGYGYAAPPPPGWWPDSHQPASERYWDGYRWTEHVRPAGGQNGPR